MLRKHPLLFLVTGVYLLGVALLTLSPAPDSRPPVVSAMLGRLRSFEPTSWVTQDVVQFLANIVLFIPIGLMFLLMLGGHRWFFVSVLGVVLSCWIELGQAALVPSRDASPEDILANLVGTVVGVIVASVALSLGSRRMRAASERRTRRFTPVSQSPGSSL